MRETRTYGSVRGVPGNRHPYRDPFDFRSVEEWKQTIRDEAKGKRGRFRILTREIFSSEAYAALSLAEEHVLLCYLNKLFYESPNSTDAKNFEKRTGRKKTDGRPVNGNNLVVTNNEIKARGKVKGNKQIAAARRRLHWIGFLDVVVPARFPQPGIYSISEHWRPYPCLGHRPKNQVPVAFAPYPNIKEFNEQRKSPCGQCP